MIRSLVLLAILVATIGFVAAQTTPAPTPDPTFTCPSNADSVEAHPTDCTKFYECTHGDAWLFQCPDKLYFNPVTKQCDWPQNVDCKAKPTAQVKQIFGQECLNHTDSYTCKSNGAKPHEELCEYYYDCWEGDATLCRCTDDYLFDLEYNGCNFPEKVDCGDRIRPGTGPTPPPKETTTKGTGPTELTKEPPGQECFGPWDYTCPSDGAHPHNELCEYYYTCWEGDATICRCTGGYLFDLTYMGCNYPEKVDCGDRIRPPGPTGPTPKPTTTRGTGPTSPHFECPKDEGLFPNPEDCSTYYQCAGGNPFLENCPPGLVFNPKLSICDYPANVPECSGTKPTPTEKPTSATDKPTEAPVTGGPTNPQPTTGNPVPTDAPVTGVPTNPQPTTGKPAPTDAPGTPMPTSPAKEFDCTGKEDGNYPNPNDCFTYFACSGGEKIEEPCPDGLAFNPDTRECDWADNVPGCSLYKI